MSSSFRSQKTTISRFGAVDMPKRRKRFSSVELSSSYISRALVSEKTVAASSNQILCLSKLLIFFSSSHSKLRISSLIFCSVLYVRKKVKRYGHKSLKSQFYGAINIFWSRIECGTYQTNK